MRVGYLLRESGDISDRSRRISLPLPSYIQESHALLESKVSSFRDPQMHLRRQSVYSSLPLAFRLKNLFVRGSRPSA